MSWWSDFETCVKQASLAYATGEGNYPGSLLAFGVVGFIPLAALRGTAGSPASGMLGSIVYGITLIFSQPRLAAFRDIWHIVCILCPADISKLWSSTNLHKADAVTHWLCEIVMLFLTSYWLSYVLYSPGRASGDLIGRYKTCLWCSNLWRRIPIGGTGHTPKLSMFSTAG